MSKVFLLKYKVNINLFISIHYCNEKIIYIYTVCVCVCVCVYILYINIYILLQ